MPSCKQGWGMRPAAEKREREAEEGKYGFMLQKEGGRDFGGHWLPLTQ